MEFAFGAVDTKPLAEKGVACQIKDLAGKPLKSPSGRPVKFILLGSDSAAYRKASRDQVRSRLQAMSTGGQEELTLEEEEENVVAILAACTVGWENVEDPKGKEIKFSDDAAREVYRRYPHIRGQVDAFISRQANFISAS